MEFLLFCRVCLKEADIMQSIFTMDSDTTNDDDNMMIYEKIMHCSNVKINREINLPDNICSTCLKELQISFKFRSKVEDSDKILNSFIASTNTTYSKLNSTDEMTLNNDEIKTEDDDTDSNEYIEYNEDLEEEIDDSIGLEEEFLETKSLDNINEVSQKAPSIMDTSYEELEPEYKRNIENDPESLIDDIRKPMNNYITMNLTNTNIEDLKICKKRYVKRSETQQTNKSSAEKHSCEICGNKYKYNHSLQTHLRRHRNEKPFPCELCGKAFVLNVELKTHMRTHTGLKPYACRYCERRFSDFGSRVKHERTHTGERPYVCKVCGKAFAYSYGLSGHMLIHTGEKPFGCEKCGKHFNKKHHLKNHLQTHLKNEGKITNILNRGNEKNIQQDQQNSNKNDKLKIYTTIPNGDIIEEIITEELSEDENDLQYYVLHESIDDNILNLNNS